MSIGIQFKKWITSEVIPNIRKFGKYVIGEKYNQKLNTELDKIKNER